MDKQTVAAKLNEGWKLFWTYKGPAKLVSPEGKAKRVPKAIWEALFKEHAITHGWYEGKDFCWVPRPDFFYFSIPRRPEDMDRGQLEQEIESAEQVFDSYRECGDGISSKESVRYRSCVYALAVRYGVQHPYWGERPFW